MSSILKALRKLESEKSQRDELSTAVASDILRSTHRKNNRTILYVILAAVVIVLIACGSYLLALKTVDISTSRESSIQKSPDSPIRYQDTTTSPSSAATGDVQHVPQGNLPVLSGIIYHSDPASRMAIINDLPVMEGTLVADFEVKTISPDRVVLQHGTSNVTLYLEQ